MNITEFLAIAKGPERLVDYQSNSKTRRVSSYTYELGVYDNYCILTTLPLDQLVEGMQRGNFIPVDRALHYMPGTVAAYPTMMRKDDSTDALCRFYQDTFTTKLMFHVRGDTPPNMSWLRQFADSICEVYEFLSEQRASFCSPSYPWKLLDDPNYKVRIDDLLICR